MSIIHNITHQTGSYDIHIEPNCINQIKEKLIQSGHYDETKKIFIVTDKIVAGFYQNKLLSQFPNAEIITIPAGEESKSYTELSRICNHMLEHNIHRNDLIIAFGGGVVGDLAGFAASILLRGVSFIQIPTTILSQIDSSVGGKTGINTGYGKNLIGSFYQPKAVFIDTSLLKTLHKREILAGYAEMVKYGLINKPDFFQWLCDYGQDVVSGKEGALIHAISESVNAKAEIVEKDEKETSGLRMLLNLGHTFGHAIETCMHYQNILHGEAVAIGICQAMELSMKLGYLSSEEYELVIQHFLDIGLPTKYTQALLSMADQEELAEKILAIMQKDKKNNANQLTFILMKGIGKAFVETGIHREDVASIVNQHLAPYNE